MTEDQLIERCFAPIAGEGGLGLRDDAALFSPRPGHDLILTADALVAGVHFFPDDPPPAVAHKALAVNVSDLVAKGSRPAGFLLALALPDDWQAAWLESFCAGLDLAAKLYAIPLLGGDTVLAKGPLSMSVTALGEVPAGRMVRRTTARPGDRLCVTGTIGDAALGLALRLDPGAAWGAVLHEGERAFLIDRYLHPRPHPEIAAILRDHASAAMDISDGLAGDLAKMMRVSRTTATVETRLIPFSPAAARAAAASPGLLDRLVTGGDDYEVLCAVPEAQLASFLDRCTEAGVPAATIGHVASGEGLPVFSDGAEQKRYERGSFSHF
jgi:thiamine-monophosphate kinase